MSDPMTDMDKCTIHIGPLPPPSEGCEWHEARIWLEVKRGTTREQLEAKADRFMELAEQSKAQHRESGADDPAVVAANQMLVNAITLYATAHRSLGLSLDCPAGSENSVERNRAAYARALELRALRLKYGNDSGDVVSQEATEAK